MIEVKAPHPYQHLTATRPSIFLAGSIEMGAAIDWQAEVVESLLDLDIIVLNPRRDDWDSTWVQSKDNPQFREQVKWELEAAANARWVMFYFDPKTKSPITLLELGLIAGSDWNYQAIVCCPDGYWRKGNVDIVCDTYGIQMIDSLDQLPSILRADMPTN